MNPHLCSFCAVSSPWSTFAACCARPQAWWPSPISGTSASATQDWPEKRKWLNRPFLPADVSRLPTADGQFQAGRYAVMATGILDHSILSRFTPAGGRRLKIVDSAQIERCAVSDAEVHHCDQKHGENEVQIDDLCAKRHGADSIEPGHRTIVVRKIASTDEGASAHRIAAERILECFWSMSNNAGMPVLSRSRRRWMSRWEFVVQRAKV